MPGAPNWAAYERAMRAHFAALDLDHWWPARSQFEMIAGALLVQNTNWANVQMALSSLSTAGKLSLAGVRSLSEAELGRLIRSAGTWRQKARRLRGFVLWLDRTHRGSLQQLFTQPTERARQQLLALEGIGEETADAILTFAGGRARFINDAYTRRIFARHGLTIDAARQTITEPRACRDWHALLVETAKRYCRKQMPDCAACPLGGLLP
ncbi:MAG: endonuclease III domain-containing protein [Acidobacteria bacterium]|nr:MAG: endonuclease III domain-containing protein [Acidobacteriota bacterium]